MNYSHVNSIPLKGTFYSLISSDEILIIKTNTVSIVSTITGFCKYYYLLPQIPRLFAINPQAPSRFAVVYGSSGNNPETLALLESQTGKVIKQFSLKSSSQKFLHISLGSHLLFVIDSQPWLIYLTQPTGTQISQYDANNPIKFLTANPTTSQFACLRHDHKLIVADALSLKQVNQVPFNFGDDNTSDTPSSLFINFKNTIITYGLYNGDINTLNLTTGENKCNKTPHCTAPISYEDGVGISSDGVLFSTETNEIIATLASPKSIRTHGSTIAVICEKTIEIYESAKRVITTVSQLQPPEPFVDNQFSLDSAIYFPASSAIYAFNLSLNEISKFTQFQDKIKKIVTCPGCVSVVYSCSEGVKVATYATGTKKRDEPGIDAICDMSKLTWILQKDSLVSYRLKSLDIEEATRISLPAGHNYTQLFRIGKTVGLYSASGDSMYVKGSKLVPFSIVAQAQILCWPAICTKDKVCIYQNTTENYEELTTKDFIVVDAKVTSCCWLAKTLFAVENRKVLAIGIDGTKRVVDRLPNTVCSIAYALPYELIFVTSLPTLRVVIIKRPFIFVALPNICANDVQSLKYILSYMPSLPIDPRAISGLQPMIAMSVFNKAPPKFVTPKTVSIYARFARFTEIVALAKQTLPEDLKKRLRKSSLSSSSNGVAKDDSDSEDESTFGVIDEDEINISHNNNNCLKNYKKIIKLIADSAYVVGQFSIAQQLYEELGDNESLYSLFMSTQNVHNLQVLALKSNLAPAIAHIKIFPPTKEDLARGFSPEYELQPNLPQPKIKQPYQGEEFTLFAGDPTDDTPLWPPSFDEPGDFGVREFVLTGEEAEQEVQIDTEEMPAAEVASTVSGEGTNESQQQQQQQQITYKERPLEEKRQDSDLKLDKFFEDDDDETEQKKINFEIDMKKAPARRVPAKNFSLDGNQSGPVRQTPNSTPLAPTRQRGNTVTAKSKACPFNIPGINHGPVISNEAPVFAPPSPSNDFSANYRSQGLPLPPNLDRSTTHDQNENHLSFSMDQSQEQSQDLSNEFKSNMFMDV